MRLEKQCWRCETLNESGADRCVVCNEWIGDPLAHSMDIVRLALSEGWLEQAVFVEKVRKEFGPSIEPYLNAFYEMMRNMPEAKGRTVTPAKSADVAFTNTLGMELVPVEGLPGVLFCKWETRVQDYRVFARATGNEWPKPNCEQGAAHPAVNVRWNDAQKFCEWLTKKERAAGTIGNDQRYRLPADWEWSVAVGLNESKEGTPESKDEKTPDVYPWNQGRGKWPPPRGAGNYDSSLGVDSFEYTSPVGSFGANANGLYDMGGNVWEWCEDFYNGKGGSRVLRGGSWSNDYSRSLLSSYRGINDPGSRYVSYGFRVVLSR